MRFLSTLIDKNKELNFFTLNADWWHGGQKPAVLWRPYSGDSRQMWSGEATTQGVTEASCPGKQHLFCFKCLPSSALYLLFHFPFHQVFNRLLCKSVVLTARYYLPNLWKSPSWYPKHFPRLVMILKAEWLSFEICLSFSLNFAIWNITQYMRNV